MTPTGRYPPSEEIASGAIHGAGTVFGVAALVFLVVFALHSGDPWKIASFSIYGATLVMMYLSSVLYHGARSRGLKRFFRNLDHASIYLLIAGTYTPFTLVSLRGPWGWTLFALVWVLTAGGIALTFSGGAERFRLLAVLTYLGMGWIAVVAIRPLLKAVSPAGFLWLAAGGLLYTCGVLFYAWKKLPFNHAVWHLFVLGGSICHFVAVWLYVLPA